MNSLNPVITTRILPLFASFLHIRVPPYNSRGQLVGAGL